ncbi:MAG: endonuclease/exonuclease/phosphatase family protein [Chitinophagaceae bacterium]|nr:endonuclease/exonuclease/phosphatase family protein [Chitinophagaceae bacterium]
MKCILFFLTALMSYGSNAQSLKLMTYNIRLDVAVDGENDWAHRKDFFAAQIQFYEPDIFGIQEARPHQVTDIANSLPTYAYTGIGRDGIGKGESSNIYYKNDRFMLKETHTFWLSPTPDSISKGWDAAFNRICTYVLLKDLRTKKIFWVFNTHLDHVGEEARTKGIQLILSRIAAVNTMNYPVIFMGDFNSEPTTERISDLKKQMNDCRDISKEKPFGPAGTFNNFKHNETVTKLIDYIFISKSAHITVKKYAVLSDSDKLKYPSDHLPVYVELKIN